jgi:N12 class adenine-specific DNA methylase
MAELDPSGLTPLDASGLTPVTRDAPQLDAGGLIPLDASGLTPLDASGGSFADYPVELGKGFLEGGKNTVATSLKGTAALAKGTERRALADMDLIDGGRRLPAISLRGGPTDVMGVQDMTPEQRQQTRAALQQAVDQPITDTNLYSAGQAIEHFGKETLAPRPGFEGSLTRDIGSGFGSVGAGIIMSILQPEVAQLMWVTSGSGEAVDNAIRAGATPEQIERAAQFGSIPGATDAVDGMLPALGGSTGRVAGLIKRVGLGAIKAAFAEGGQEGFQQFLQNVIARGIYKPDQDLLDDVPRSMLIGAIVGGTVGGGTAAAERHARAAVPMQPGDQSAVPAETILPPPAAPPDYTPVGSPVPAAAAPQPQAPAAPNAILPPDGASPIEQTLQGPFAGVSTGGVSTPSPQPQESVPVAAAPTDTVVTAQPATPPGEPHGRATLAKLLNDPRTADEIRADLARAEQERLVQDEIRETFAGAYMDASPGESILDTAIGNVRGLIEQGETHSPDGARWQSVLDELERRKREAPDQDATINAAGDLVPRVGTRHTPVQLEGPGDVHAGAEITNPNPTPAQAESGIYQKRHLKWRGWDISIETEAGVDRVAKDGSWRVTMPAPYGHILGTVGADGDPVDVTVGPNPQAPQVYVIDQRDPDTLKFDEHKTFQGFDSEQDAIAAYDASFSDNSGPFRIGAVTPMSLPQFDAWLANGNKKKAIAYEPPRAPQTAKRKVLSLFEFLAANGGIRDHGGELRHMGLDQHFIPGFGRLVRPSGKDLDTAREAAAEMGYLPNQEGTVNDLLDLLSQEAGGQRIYAAPDVAAAQDRERARIERADNEQLDAAKGEVADIIKETGVAGLTDQEVEQIAKTALINGTDPADELVAFLERDTTAAIQEAVTYEAPQEQAHDTRANVARTAGETTGEQPARPAAAAPTEAPPQREQPDQGGRDTGEPRSAPAGAPAQVAEQKPATPAVEMYLEVGNKRYQVSDYKDASEKVVQARDVFELHGGSGSNFPSPTIVDSNGKVIAHVSWNGRVWPGRPGRPGDPGDWTPDTKPLYDNRDTGLPSVFTDKTAKPEAPTNVLPEPRADATPAWFAEYTTAGREELARKALIPQAVRISKMNWQNISQPVRDKLEAAHKAGLEQAPAEPIVKKVEESPDGLQGSVPRSDAPAGAEDVSQPVRAGQAGGARGGEGAGSASTVSPTDGERAEAAERLPTGAVGEGGRGAGEGNADRLSEREQHADDNGDRRPAERAPTAASSVEGENFSIAPGASAEGRSWKTKAEDNVRAIELSRKIEAEGRPATREEQEQLAKYVGWGGIKGAFPDTEGKFGKGLEAIGAKIKDLLSETEYATARRSIQYAHYTAEDVVRAMWSAADRLGFKAGKVFEPGMGVGNFAGMMPPDLAAHTQYVGLELDHTTARIAKLLYPRWGVRRDDFTKAPLPENTFDLVIGNPPFADVVIKADPKYAKHRFYLHDYFFAKSLDAVRPGGVLMFISSAGTMNKKDPSAREYLADRADLVGAIRLPSNAFTRNAGTEVTTDIVILRKRMPDEKAGDRTWTETVETTMPNRLGKDVTGLVNRYFAEHPEMVLGEPDFADKLYENRYSVKARPGADLKAELAKAIDTLPTDAMSEWKGPVESGDKDFGTVEKKEGTFYVGPKGELLQISGGVGVPIAQRGKGVEGGRTAADIERIRALVPIRDALRAVYDADLNADTENGDRARAKLNKEYDGFVGKFGPINKAVIQKRRPNAIQQESARNEAREEARYAGLTFDEGTFDPTNLLKEGKTLSEISRARAKARDEAKAAGRTFDEGTFDPDEMPDVIIDKRPNVDPFMDDPESYRLRAIERYDDSNDTASKGPVFFENLITKDRAPKINGVDDAVLYVLNQKGRLDLEQIATLTGKTESQAIEELGERIFKEPGTDGAWVTRDEYLSGNVLKKLAIAKAAADRNPQFRRNVVALEAAQPMPLAPSQIHASMGMPWIPAEIVSQFATEHMKLDAIKVKYVPAIAQWIVSGDTGSAAAVTTWGTDRRAAPALMSDVLNRQQSKIFDTYRGADGKTHTELNVAATQAAQDKANAIKEAFDSWIYADEARADKLAQLYNEKYNNLVVRDFDGSYLTTPGISKHWSWRPHQTRVVARIIQEGNTYMAHAVGAGKTSAMIGAGMEMRRLGLVRKPMYAVPNHMLGQFTKEFYEQYPTAKIAVADERRFHTDTRKQFIANVAVEDLDAIIITHSALGMIPISDSFQDGIIRREVNSYRELLNEIPKDQENRITRSRIEKQIERLEQRLEGKNNKRRDQVFTFEEMGADFLFVDEAHLFRKLDFTTKMSNLKGITPEGSAQAWDLYMKALYLDSINPGRSLVMASGTPVTNTMAELFTLSRFMQPQELEERGLSRFDAWAGAFGEPVTELEQDAAGGYKPVTRFAKFVNVAELSAMVRQVMDVVTSRQLEQYVTRPKLKGGKRIMNLAEKTPALERFQRTLAARMEAIAKRKGPPKKGDDILLSVINDGRHAAIDLRLAGIEPDGKSKLDLMIDNVFRIWKDTKRQPFYKPKGGGEGYESKPFDHGPATQMVFANLGLSGARGFSVPDYIRSELARRGVPRDQIAYIYNYKSHVARQKLFNDMNDGKVRILIGSTAKMATGVNAQRRLYAIHNQDPLWYPADDEQRNGRGIRQGNLNPEIEINDYSTKGTYDSTMWGLMEKKARFIQGFFEGDPSMRDMEDLGEASQYAQAKALTTNDPRLIKLTELKQDLQKAERRKSAFEQEAYALKSRRASAVSEEAHYTNRIENTKKDIERRQDISGDKFTAKVGNTTYDKRADFGAAVMERFDEIAKETPVVSKPRKVAEIGGFPLFATPRKWTEHVIVDAHIERTGKFETDVEVGHSALGLVRSAEARLERFERELEEYKQRAATAAKFLKESAAAVGKKFEGNAEIARLEKEVRELEADLARPVTPVDKAMQAELIRVSSLDEIEQLGRTGNVIEMPERGAPFQRRRAAGDMFSDAPRGWDEIEAGEPQHMSPADIAKVREIVQRVARLDPSFAETLEMPKGSPGALNWGKPEGGKAAGVYRGTIDAITVALDIGSRRTGYHESFHRLQRHFLNAREQDILASEIEKLRDIIRNDVTRRDVGRMSREEIEAEAFAIYASNRDAGAKLNHILQRAWNRLRLMLDRLRNVLHGMEYQTSEDIFEKARSGEIADRLGPIAYRSLAPVYESGRPVFSSDAEIGADGKPQLVLPGAERSTKQQLQKRAEERKRSSKAQKTVDGLPLFAGEPDPQGDLFSLAEEPRTAVDRQRVMQGFLARGQYLDRAIRLPFEFFGGVTRDGQWKWGAKLFEGASNVITGASFSPESRFAFLNPVLETARAGLVDRYGLDPQYVERERAKALDERAVMLQGAAALKSLAAHSVGPAEARVLQAILTGEDVGENDMAHLAEPIRAAVDQLGQEAVDMGMVSAESFERNRGTYLHRVYKKYEAEQHGLVRMVNNVMGSRRKKIIGDQFRGRGMFQEITLQRLMKDVQAWHDGARGKPANGEKFIRLDEMPDQAQLELDDNATAEKPLRTVYWPADQAIPERYDNFTNQGTWEVRGEKGGKIVIWRDFTKAERAKMGEILDARYTIGKTFMLMAHDLAVGKFYKDISENEDWSRSTPPAGEWLEASEWNAQWRRLKTWKRGDIEWVRVPDVEIPNSGGKKRWGALAGRFVREEIWRDLNEQDIMSKPGVWRALLTQWKLNKTARSPVVHMNNVISNFVLMDLLDVRMQDLVAGIRSYVTKDQSYQEAFENGAFGADMISQEIRNNVLKPVLDEIMRDNTFQQGHLGALGQMSRLTELIWSKAKAFDKGMRDLYAFEDELFRMATYNRRRELGDTPRQAANHAREQFIDYDIRAPWIAAARNTVLPFISYTYRAAPLIARAVATRPWKLGKYYLLAYALNALAYGLTGDDDEDAKRRAEREDKERRSLREREQGRAWIGTYQMTRMPFNDRHGLPVFLDTRRWVPAGDVFDMSDGDIPAWLNIGGPLMIGAEIALNRSAFTKQEIVNDKTDDWWDRQGKRADHLYKSAMPSAAWVPNSWYWEKIENAVKGATDRQGRPYSLPLALSSSVGIKLKPQDVDDALDFKAYQFKKIEEELAKEARRLSGRKDRGIISESAFNKAMADIEQKRERNGKKADETLNGTQK